MSEKWKDLDIGDKMLYTFVGSLATILIVIIIFLTIIGVLS